MATEMDRLRLSRAQESVAKHAAALAKAQERLDSMPRGNDTTEEYVSYNRGAGCWGEDDHPRQHRVKVVDPVRLAYDAQATEVEWLEKDLERSRSFLADVEAEFATEADAHASVIARAKGLDGKRMRVDTPKHLTNDGWMPTTFVVEVEVRPDRILVHGEVRARNGMEPWSEDIFESGSGWSEMRATAYCKGARRDLAEAARDAARRFVESRA